MLALGKDAYLPLGGLVFNALGLSLLLVKYLVDPLSLGLVV